ncbi:hypothetical protein CC1G_05655 [Coprinopsis cinerea okayama7|uniref:Uncharacterized protein n=1 Tax=Coprinopsis cinerea (strain Okayama-7 / 130 / ATCC MYA-4618 / FGSC 9003) TaxID=240176 RepID=A8P1T7_COPC7|nr:hypothetical protein CC1G_05655 [Coprinopsis cinerea okayama7\|eukprot:XP_001838174.2 hypothetical protein CC1G_05655 [Coprinopsis cinerea okayama7\
MAYNHNMFNGGNGSPVVAHGQRPYHPPSGVQGCYSPSLGYHVQAAPARLPQRHDEDVYEETVGLQPAFYPPQDLDYLGQQSTPATSFTAPNMDRRVLPSGLPAISSSFLPSVSQDVASGSGSPIVPPVPQVCDGFTQYPAAKRVRRQGYQRHSQLDASWHPTIDNIDGWLTASKEPSSLPPVISVPTAQSSAIQQSKSTPRTIPHQKVPKNTSSASGAVSTAPTVDPSSSTPSSSTAKTKGKAKPDQAKGKREKRKRDDDAGGKDVGVKPLKFHLSNEFLFPVHGAPKARRRKTGPPKTSPSNAEADSGQRSSSSKAKPPAKKKSTKEEVRREPSSATDDNEERTRASTPTVEANSTSKTTTPPAQISPRTTEVETPSIAPPTPTTIAETPFTTAPTPSTVADAPTPSTAPTTPCDLPDDLNPNEVDAHDKDPEPHSPSSSTPAKDIGISLERALEILEGLLEPEKTETCDTTDAEKFAAEVDAILGVSQDSHPDAD